MTFGRNVKTDMKIVDQPSVSGRFERCDIIIAESHFFTNQCVLFPLLKFQFPMLTLGINFLETCRISAAFVGLGFGVS